MLGWAESGEEHDAQEQNGLNRIEPIHLFVEKTEVLLILFSRIASLPDESHPFAVHERSEHRPIHEHDAKKDDLDDQPPLLVPKRESAIVEIEDIADPRRKKEKSSKREKQQRRSHHRFDGNPDILTLRCCQTEVEKPSHGNHGGHEAESQKMKIEDNRA